MRSKNVVMKNRNKLRIKYVIFEKFVMPRKLVKTTIICYTFAAWNSKQIINTKIKYYEQQKNQIQNAARFSCGDDFHSSVPDLLRVFR